MFLQQREGCPPRRLHPFSALLPLARLAARLLAVDAKIIVRHRHGAVRIDAHMHGLVHQEIIPRTLADNPEIVYGRYIRLPILERILKALLCNASRLVIGTSGLAGAADALWLEMEVATDIVAIDRERDQGVEGAAQVHNFPGATSSAGHENGHIDVRFVVDLYRRVGRRYRNGERNEVNRQYWRGIFHLCLPNVISVDSFVRQTLTKSAA